MKVKQLKEMKPEDLNKRLRELRLELMKERANVVMGRSVKNTSKIRQLRREIARILTIKRERTRG